MIIVLGVLIGFIIANGIAKFYSYINEIDNETIQELKIIK
jgi:hypothetical protein